MKRAHVTFPSRPGNQEIHPLLPLSVWAWPAVAKLTIGSLDSAVHTRRVGFFALDVTGDQNSPSLSVSRLEGGGTLRVVATMGEEYSRGCT